MSAVGGRGGKPTARVPRPRPVCRWITPDQHRQSAGTSAVRSAARMDQSNGDRAAATPFRRGPAPVAPEDPHLNHRLPAIAGSQGLPARRRTVGFLPASVSRAVAETAVPSWSHEAPTSPLSARTGCRSGARWWPGMRRSRSGPRPLAVGRLVDEALVPTPGTRAASLRLQASPRTVLAAARYQGYKHLEAVGRPGGGRFLALPHLGGWEWCGRDLGLHGHPIVTWSA